MAVWQTLIWENRRRLCKHCSCPSLGPDRPRQSRTTGGRDMDEAGGRANSFSAWHGQLTTLNPLPLAPPSLQPCACVTHHYLKATTSWPLGARGHCLITYVSVKKKPKKNKNKTNSSITKKSTWQAAPLLWPKGFAHNQLLCEQRQGPAAATDAPLWTGSWPNSPKNCGANSLLRDL